MKTLDRPNSSAAASSAAASAAGETTGGTTDGSTNRRREATGRPGQPGARQHRVERVALAYSGGLDTSVMIPWLRENYGCEIVAIVADVGQREDFDAVRRKAVATGASECRVLDLKEEFLQACVLPALRAGAVYQDRYLLGTALARPVIARGQVRVARETNCDALAHGCTGKGNDQVRFELAYGVLAPEIAVIAPWREWDIRSRRDALAYADERGVPVAASRDRPYSVDENLWHVSFEGGVLEDPATPAPPDTRRLTRPPGDRPDTPRRIQIGFREGVPVTVDGEELGPVALVERLNAVAGEHGVGRVDVVEDRLVGMKSRGVYETPGGTVLHAALRDLESVTLDADTARFARSVGERYAELVYRGQWFTPLRRSLDAFVADAHRGVDGTVTVELFQGDCSPVARSSPHSLYREELATFGEDAVYDQTDAGGFIHLWGLPSRIAARARARARGEVRGSTRASSEPYTAPEPRQRSDAGATPAHS